MFFEVFFVVWKYNMIFNFERLRRMHETKFFFYVLMKTGYFNTGFVFLRYKNTNQYQAKFSRKIHTKISKKEIFLKFLFPFFLGRTHLLGLGPTIRAGPKLAQPWTVALYCSHATWTVEASSEGEEGRRERRGNWPTVAVVEAHGGASWWRWYWRWNGGGSRQRSFSLLSSASLHFFSFLPLFFSSFFLSVFSSFPFLLCSFPLFFFLLLPPFVFIGKNRGWGWGEDPYYPYQRGRVVGRPLCSRPRTTLGVHPLFFYHVAGKWGVLSASFWVVFKKRGREKQGKEIFFFPCLARPGEEEDPQCRSKRHHLGLCFFFWNNAVLPKTHRFI